MIETFGDKNTEKVWNNEPCKKFSAAVQESAREVMAIVDALVKAEELFKAPGLKAHKLTERGRPNLWSLRVNIQYRVTFDWVEETQSAYNVTLQDYH
jgi:toxin HigB-1